MTNEDRLLPVIRNFRDKIRTSDFVVDKTGVKIVEIINAHVELDPSQPILDFQVRKTPLKYVKAELAWYDSQDLHITKISEHAKMWEKVSGLDGYVNSNYGWMIYSMENFNQFEHCAIELERQPDSRRAVMIYQRPSMWVEHHENGKSDFVCTDGTQLFIRNGKLIYIVKQRSCDFIFGFFNDFYWHCEVHRRMLERLKKVYPGLHFGSLHYDNYSLHVYERHFEMIEKIGDIYGL